MDTDLIARLRSWRLPAADKAAAALEAQARRIEELMAALKAALRYIENTEDELGIELDCRFAARAVYLGEKE